jgi:hypothetical protein
MRAETRRGEARVSFVRFGIRRVGLVAGEVLTVESWNVKWRN